MKYFFLALFLFTTITIHTMQHNQEEHYSDSSLSKSKKTSLKWVRVAINQDNDKRRKWAYICQECKKQVLDIVRHKRSKHTHERPYTCSICKQKFVESGACVNHIRSTHKNEDLQNATYIVKLSDKEPFERAVKKKKTVTSPNSSDQSPLDNSESNLNDIEDSDIANFISEQILLDLDQILVSESPASLLESTTL